MLHCGGDAFGPESRQNTRHPVSLPQQQGVTQIEYIVAGTVSHRRHDLLIGQAATAIENVQFLNFLSRRQQITFHPPRQQADTGMFSQQSALAYPVIQPAHQCLTLNRPELHEYPDFIQSLKPAGFLFGCREFYQADNQDGIADWTPGIPFQRGCRQFFRFGRQSEINDPGFAEQGSRLASRLELTPIEMTIGIKQLMAGITLDPGRLADGIQCLGELQRFIPAQQINRGQGLFEMPRQFVAMEFHDQDVPLRSP